MCLDWGAVLKELPARFTTRDVVEKTRKPQGQVYAGISRWMKGKQVRQIKDGYQKISAR
jgi:hypothetical protein